LRKALETYYASQGYYPYFSTSESTNGCCFEDDAEIKTALSPYISENLKDPLYNPAEPFSLEKYCYHYKTEDQGKEYKIRVNYETGGYKEVASGGGSEIVYGGGGAGELQEWAKTFGGAGSELIQSSQQTSDGGYTVGGQTMSFGAGSYDLLFIKIGSNGDISGCSPLQDVTPSVSSVTPLIGSPSIIMNSYSLGGVDVSLSVSSPIVDTSMICPE